MSKFLTSTTAAVVVGLTFAIATGVAEAQSSGGSGGGASGSSARGSSAPLAAPRTTGPRVTSPAPNVPPQAAPGNSALSNPATGTPGVTTAPGNTTPGVATTPGSTTPGGSTTNPSQQSTSGIPPPAATVQPAPQQQPVSPLSPQVQPPVASGGGSARQGSLALSPGGSENSPSAPGGGGKSLADCMKFWEPATHMTKQEWRGACQRTIGRLNR